MTKREKDITGLSVRPKHGYVYIKKAKNSPGNNGHWSQKKRMEAVTTYLSTGNLALTGRLCNIPEDTIRKWKAQDWWTQLTDKYYEEDDIALSSKLKKTLDKTIEAVNDRIENGEYLYDSRTGKLKRVPVKLRDAHRVASDLIDKQLILRKQKPVSLERSDESQAGKLAKLAEAFAAFATGKVQEEKIVNEIVEGEYHELPPNYQESINAFHDEREARLSEGTQLGENEETQTSEGQGDEKFREGNGG